MGKIMKQVDILFSILTLPEVLLLRYVGSEFHKKGYKIGFILFHEAGEDLLEGYPFLIFNIHKIKKDFKLREKSVEELEKEYGILNFRELLIREKISYNRKDEKKLENKASLYLQILDDVFQQTHPRCVVQELGDFVANKCVYYAARKNNIDHIFYEPAPFKQRIVFTLNSYYADIPDELLNKEVNPEVKKRVEEYVNEYLQKGEIVIPFKDKFSFGDATIRKFLNFEYLKRLKRKIIHKYFQKKEEEYSEIGWVIRCSVLKWFRRKILTPYYFEPKKKEKYIFFPLHVPFDIQITTRSKLFYNQIGFLEYLSRIIPFGYKLYIKEHPAAVGGYSFWGLRNLLKEHNNVKLIHPRVSSYHLIKNAELIISVNSKVGFEALMQNKKVVVVGDALYKNKGITFDVDNINNLERVVKKALESSDPNFDRILKFLYAVYEGSYPTELFLIEEENLKNSFRSFYDFIHIVL